MTFNISQAVQALGASHVMSNPYGYNEPYGLRPTQATYQAVSRMFSPPATAARRCGAEPEPARPTVVPGPLGIWQPRPSARPYEQIGKFGVNLLGPPPGVAPGAPTMAMQEGRPPSNCGPLPIRPTRRTGASSRACWVASVAYSAKRGRSAAPSARCSTPRWRRSATSRACRFAG